MCALTWIIDPTSGDLTVEGLTENEVYALTGDLLPVGVSVNCARPAESAHLLAQVPTAVQVGPPLRVGRIYHGSVVDGPGRRSVVQLQGCTAGCPACYAPETHDPMRGLAMAAGDVVACLLDAAGEPRDGVTVTGGEPFLQPSGLLALLRALKARGVHVVVYTGYALEDLAAQEMQESREALRLIDLLIDGPFVAALAEGAGEWRGSRNQRLIPHPGRTLAPVRASLPLIS